MRYLAVRTAVVRLFAGATLIWEALWIVTTHHSAFDSPSANTCSTVTVEASVSSAMTCASGEVATKVSAACAGSASASLVTTGWSSPPSSSEHPANVNATSANAGIRNFTFFIT